MYKRSVGLSIFLCFITFGIYPIYWFVKLTNETNTLAKRENSTSGGLAFLLWILTGGLYSIYWSYKWGEYQDEALEAYGLPKKDNSVLYLILSLLCLDFVVWAMMQSTLNSMLPEEGESSNGSANNAPQNNQSPAPAPAPQIAPAPQYVSEKVVTIRGISGMYSNQTFKMRDGDEIVFGRDSSCCNIVFRNSEATVSRKHCSIRYIGSKDMYLLSVYSQNGVLVDGNLKVYQNESRMISRGSIISLATDANRFLLG